MQLAFNVEIPPDQFMDLLRDQITRNGIVIMGTDSVSPQVNVDALPPIGAYWEGQGGTFAGIVRGRDGGPDYALIKGQNIDACEWKNMLDSAASITIDGHKDFRLPYRAEQSVLYANLPDEFEKKWYWSCEQHPGVENYAYAQNFSDGDQYDIDKALKCLGCAVRTIPLW